MELSSLGSKNIVFDIGVVLINVHNFNLMMIKNIFGLKHLVNSSYIYKFSKGIRRNRRQTNRFHKFPFSMHLANIIF